ncbi:growth differentiation factor 8 [Sarotherodon galilaeus]
MQCKLCLPGETELAAFKNSTSNLRKHVVFQLIQPNQTRWNLTYIALERIIRIIQEKGEDAIRNVCEEFKVKMLSPAEIAFLTEYCTVMKPVVNRLETSTKMCLPLIRAIQDGVQKRFGGMMEDPELIAAAILLPKFKTTWTERPDIIEAGLLIYVRQHLDQMAEAGVEQVKQHSSDEKVFFFSMKSKGPQGTGELDGYLACVSDKMDLLNSFPHIKKLSLKLNTGLPASAACERLFSCAGLLFTAKRARMMSSTNFENQLLHKINRKFRE